MTAAATARTNLLGMTRAELEAFVGGFGAKPYRARQLLKWIYRRGEHDFSRMTDLAKDFRAALAERATVSVPEIVAARTASDGTRKWLLRMPGASGGEQVIETVFIPEPGRGTLCISSQVGCALDCAFCATGAQGFNRNLTAAEIIGQV
jgi:23S rRNA (adenine2503-C2)-methyltransferase